jgi:hypothetical protein
VDIENTIEFILSHQANAEVQMEKFREGMAELRTAIAAQAEVQAKGYAQHELIMAKIDARLDRAIRLSVQDARAQRKRNQEFDEKMTQLSAAQLVTEEKMQVTEEKLQRYLDSLKPGGNGHN